jgi:hypothetical protein
MMRWLLLFLSPSVLFAQEKRTQFAIDHPAAAGTLVSHSVPVETLPTPTTVVGTYVGVTPPMMTSGSTVMLEPKQLARMSEKQLEVLYRLAQPGPIPQGYTPGIAIFNAGSPFTNVIAQVVGCSAWQGKYFEDPATMINKTFGVKAIKTVIYLGESYVDGRPSTILDYSVAPRMFQRYRDEIREVAPGIYLGILYRREACGPKRVSWFTLDARGCQTCIVGR